MPKNNTSVEELLKEFAEVVGDADMLRKGEKVATAREVIDKIAEWLPKALTHLQEQTRREERLKIRKDMGNIMQGFTNKDTKEPIRKVLAQYFFKDKLDSQESDRWCQGCLIKLKENAIRCSHCGKEAKSYYTDNDFDDNGEIKV